MVFHGTANIWEVRGRLTQDAARQANFAIDLIGPTGQPAPADLALHAPTLGEHSTQVLQEAGFATDEIDRLRANHTITTTETPR